MGRLLSSMVQIRQQFLRSIRIDADYGRIDALNGFVIQPSAKLALETLTKHINETQQRAFTWTGPYGGGKSSLALALASLVHPDKRVQNAARAVLSVQRGDLISRAFDASPGDGWAVLPVVGRRTQTRSEIALAIDRLPRRTRRTVPANRRDVVAELVELAERRKQRGVLLVIDELGKFLEASAQSGEDIYLFQQLAEAACRAKGKLVIVGILHQAFDQYASRLGRDARDEWAKVQGRYVDISLAPAADETVDMISRAIEAVPNLPDGIGSFHDAIARSVADRRPAIAPGLSARLKNCWPLHPVTALLLGPCFRRRFGQNERSIFGFLNSVEPMGFREYLETTESHRLSYYLPSQFWDYLRANFEPAILASPDGHRWAVGVDAIERVESKGDRIHVVLIKTIALIDLFRNGSGLAADDLVLKTCVPTHSASDVEKALDDLRRWSVTIFRRHLGAWGVYAGSDFDIESALIKARPDIEVNDLEIIRTFGELPPVLAKRTYQETGAMRFLKKTVLSPAVLAAYLASEKDQEPFCGEFILLLPDLKNAPKATHALAKETAHSQSERGIILGVPDHSTRIAEAAHELTALRKVFAESTALEADKVAAKEIDARIRALHSELEDLLRDAFRSARWYWGDRVFSGSESKSLSAIASLVANQRFRLCPILQSELINRESPSSNSVKARRDLMHRMLNNADVPSLGYDGFPADAGIYFSILHATTIHREEDSRWSFHYPGAGARARSLRALWKAADRKIKKPAIGTSLEDLYKIWRDPPFGVKRGVLPVLGLSYFLANRNCLAVYHDDVFIPDLTEVHVDEWLQDTGRIKWKYFEIDSANEDVLQAIASCLPTEMGISQLPSPLEAARTLVSFILRLPEWTKRTNLLVERTRQVRQILLRASDPHRVLFVDIPALLSGSEEPFPKLLAVCISELESAYSAMLRGVESKLFEALDHTGALDDLRKRGAIVSGISGDFRLDAFALRISEYRGRPEDIQALISLAVNKPERDWADRDIEFAYIQLGSWSMEFRRVEMLAPLRSRPATRRSFAVVFGLGNGRKAFSESFDISVAQSDLVTELAARILSHRQTAKSDIFLAALAEAGVQVVQQKPRSDNNGD